MKEIRKGCVLRNKYCPEVKVWVISFGYNEGIALVSVPDKCQVGDSYDISNKDNWELTDEFYDVAEVVTKMQKGEE